jgi:3-dehydroshikimate dehydratase
MRKSIATASLSGTLEEKLEVAAHVGFDGIELFENDLISCPLTPFLIGQRAKELGLRIDLYQPFRDFEGVPDELLAQNLRRAEHKFHVMAEVGVDTILVCSSVSPRSMGDDARATDQLGLLAEAAALHSVRVAYHALAWGRHVNDYRHAWKLVAAVNHANLGLCLNSLHILSRPDDPSGIRAIPGEKIFFVQLADARNMHIGSLQWNRQHRGFARQGDSDLTDFMAHVLSAGYRGPLSLEFVNDVFRRGGADRTATDAFRALVALEQSLGGRIEASQRPTASGAVDIRDRLELARPEPPEQLRGYAFVEISVDPLAELAAQSLLRGMGFVSAGRHKSKPVQMWRHGEARVLLNRSRSGRDDWPRGEAAICAIALERHDPRRSAERAQALLAATIPRAHGPAGADLPAVAAPDGMAVFLCRTDASDDTGWLADFDIVNETDAQFAWGVSKVDYVSLSPPASTFDEAALFYESVLGLHRWAGMEPDEQYGQVRSHAMTNDDCRVRLVLDMPALVGGPLPEPAGCQHIAFACEDIFATANQMRSARLPTLSIPGNYYDDLAARTRLDWPTIDLMREFAILYDIDELGGTYFHFFTAVLGRRLFFEVVQRANSYDGYGTRNAPVRMAAQYRQLALAGVIG